MIDGAGHFRIFFRIIMPMSLPPDHHARDPAVHRRVERVLLAPARRPDGGLQGPHRRARSLPVADTPRVSGLGRPDGRHPDRRGPRHGPLRHLRPADRQLHRLHRHQVMSLSRNRTRRATRSAQERNAMNRTMTRVLAVVAALPLFTLAACSGGDDGGGGSGGSGGQIDYWLWDANQQPAYQKCADAFAAKNPGTTVKITQRGWDDYWSTLTTGFQSDTAPDVFTDHLSKYPEFVKNKVILPLDEVVPDINPASVRQGPGRALGRAGRQALRPAQGLGHRRALLQQEDGQGCRHHRRGDGQPDLEPGRRRHLREGHRQAHRRQERQARRRARLRQEERRGLRPRPPRLRRRQRPDRVELLHRDRRAGSTPTRTRGARRTSTTTPASRRPSPGGRA